MTMVEYIFNNHKNDSGIVYCLTKKVSAVQSLRMGGNYPLALGC